ncbi:MAG: hypothetical protein B6U72_03055 [Candidatus Altiarchaeales archaeon ex4484_2]|nr:MAG: hypothetical protein B6U72_03055 [Candidatus Altiarchaeales archaeon ex4484_2]
MGRTEAERRASVARAKKIFRELGEGALVKYGSAESRWPREAAQGGDVSAAAITSPSIPHTPLGVLGGLLGSPVQRQTVVDYFERYGIPQEREKTQPRIEQIKYTQPTPSPFSLPGTIYDLGVGHLSLFNKEYGLLGGVTRFRESEMFKPAETGTIYRTPETPLTEKEKQMRGMEVMGGHLPMLTRTPRPYEPAEQQAEMRGRYIRQEARKQAMGWDAYGQIIKVREGERSFRAEKTAALGEYAAAEGRLVSDIDWLEAMGSDAMVSVEGVGSMKATEAVKLYRKRLEALREEEKKAQTREYKVKLVPSGFDVEKWEKGPKWLKQLTQPAILEGSAKQIEKKLKEYSLKNRESKAAMNVFEKEKAWTQHSPESYLTSSLQGATDFVLFSGAFAAVKGAALTGRAVKVAAAGGAAAYPTTQYTTPKIYEMTPESWDEKHRQLVAGIAGTGVGLLVGGGVMYSLTKVPLGVGTKVKIPTKGGDKTIWRGLSVEYGHRAQPILGRTPQGWKLGTPKKLKFSTGGFRNLKELSPTDTKIITSNLPYKKVELVKLRSALRSMGATQNIKSAYVQKQFTRGVKYLKPRGVDEVLKTAKQYKGTVYGTVSQKAQSLPGFRQPADIDLQFTFGQDKAAKIAKDLSRRLKARGMQTRIRPENPLLIETKVGGEWHHAVDIHAGGSAYGEVIPERGFGFRYTKKGTKIEGIKAMGLGEQGLRKGSSSVSLQPEGVAPPEHRTKDILDFIHSQRTLIASGRQSKLYRLGVGRGKLAGAEKALNKYEKVIMEQYPGITKYGKGKSTTLLYSPKPKPKTVSAPASVMASSSRALGGYTPMGVVASPSRSRGSDILKSYSTTSKSSRSWGAASRSQSIRAYQKKIFRRLSQPYTSGSRGSKSTGATRQDTSLRGNIGSLSLKGYSPSSPSPGSPQPYTSSPGSYGSYGFESPYTTSPSIKLPPPITLPSFGGGGGSKRKTSRGYFDFGRKARVDVMPLTKKGKKHTIKGLIPYARKRK